MNVRVDRLSLTQVVSGGLVLGGVLGLLGTLLEKWTRAVDAAIEAADLGPALEKSARELAESDGRIAVLNERAQVIGERIRAIADHTRP